MIVLRPDIKTAIVLILLAIVMAIIISTVVKKDILIEVSTEKHPAIEVVEKHIVYSANNQWDKVIPLLSGTALIETKSNIQKVNNTVEVVDKKTKVIFETDNLVKIYADVTFADNRQAYNFYLNYNNGWKIHKVELTEFIRPKLTSGELPDEVKTTIKEYFALSTSEKRQQDYRFLAGKLLQASQFAKQIKGIELNAPELSQQVISINPVGVSPDYVISEVLFINKGLPGRAIVELIKVNECWRIVNLDITFVHQ